MRKAALNICKVSTSDLTRSNLMLGITRFFTILFSVFLLNIVAMTASAATYITAEPNDVGLIDIEIKTAYRAGTTSVYAVTGDSNSNLYQVDLSTGSASLVGNLGVSKDFEALAFSPSGTLYALEDRDFGLYTVNTFNGAATFVGSTGLSGADNPGMTFDDDGRLWLVGGNSTATLYEINPSTAASSLVGTVGSFDGWSLASHLNTLYMIDGKRGGVGDLYTVDKATAGKNLVGSLSISGVSQQHGMSSDGVSLWLLNESNRRLYQLNTATGAASVGAVVSGHSGALESLAAAVNLPTIDVTITALELPSWLSLYDNGDGTATIQGYPVLEGGYNFILRVEDGFGGFVDKTYSVSSSPVSKVSTDGDISSGDGEEEGYDNSNKEETVVEESAGAIDHSFILMFMLIAGLRFQRRKS
jgi:hypothetical protein